MSRRSFPFLSVALVALGLLAPAAASADPGALSTRLDQLAGKNLRDASRADQADAVSLLSGGAGSLMRDGGSLVVQIRVSGDPADSLAAIRNAGADVTHVSDEYQTITASVDEGDLRAVAAISGVVSVEEVIAPMSGSVDQPGGGAAADAGSNDTCATGTAISEAVTQMKTDAARSQFDVDGSGVKVGILSDSFDRRVSAATHPADDIAAGDLPGPGNPCGRTTPVQVLDDTATFNLNDEGRAMLQAVHDIAPGASLAFATADNADTAFADNIRALATAGADVISDDFIYFNEPFYQDSVIAKAVNDVTAQGIPYFSMAFNNNRVIAGNDSNSWEAPAYRSTTCPPLVTALGGGNDCMDFDPGVGVDNSFNLTATTGTPFRIDLQWAEPWFGVTTNFDVFLINLATNSISASSTNVNATTQKPFEFAAFAPGNSSLLNYQVVIRRTSGTGTPRIKWVNSDNGAGAIAGLEYPVSANGDTVGPTIFGHNGAASAQTVGAVPFSNSSTVEPFSSRGPVTHLFGPVDGVTPAAPLGSPEVLSKPDVVATDEGANSFFGLNVGGGIFRFFGTSQASPHAAAVAALQLSANPSLSQAQVMANQRSTADPVGSAGPLVAGSGLIDAPAAIAAGDTTPPTLSITKGPSKKTKSKKAKFSFSTEAGATLACKLDKGSFSTCSTNASFKVKPGKHTLRVHATDMVGNVSADTTYKWTVKKKKKKKHHH